MAHHCQRAPSVSRTARERQDETVTLPRLTDLLASVHVVALPLTTRFRGVDVREVALWDGPHGWTEFSPFLEYDDAESSAWLAAALDFGWSPTPPAVTARVGVNATVPAVTADRVGDVLARFPGCRTAKVKVAEPGQTLADDVARVRAARDFLGAEGRVRIDANGAWNVDEAERALHALAEFDLEYAEQPCATVDELAQLRRRVADWDIPIAADESVRKADDPLAVARAGAADLLVVKVQPLGGIPSARRIVAEAGLPVVVSSALESSIGLSMGLALAASLDGLDLDCGLGTAALLARDVVTDPLIPTDGSLAVGRLTPDAGLLAELAAGPARVDWWRARVERCYALLERGAQT
jgi:O-succinylbenzoate synthase